MSDDKRAQVQHTGDQDAPSEQAKPGGGPSLPRGSSRDRNVAPTRQALATISIVAAGVGTAAIVAALIWWVVTNSLIPGPLIVLVAGAVLGGFAVVANFASIRQCLGSRRAQLIANSTAFALLVLGIVVLVNYVGIRHHLRKDLTEAQRYSLSEQTRKIAKGLDKDVELLAFISPGSFNYAQTSDRLREYEMLSPRIKLHTYDPQTNFDKVKEYEVQFDGTIIVKSGEKTERVTGASEEQLTSAILAVTSGEKTKVYFLAGHGERPLQDGGMDGLGTIKGSLENQQYQVEALSMVAMAEPQVPADCAVLVIAGPQQPLHEKEITAIKDYVGQDGKLFVGVDPAPAPDLQEILTDHGVTPLDGVVIDPQRGYWGQAQVPVVIEPAAHDITRNIDAIALPDTRAFQVEASSPPPQYPGAPPPPPQAARALLESSSGAWLETEPRGEVTKDADEKSGPLTMAAVIDESPPPPPQMPGMPSPPQPEGGTRMVVVGSSVMMTDRLIQAGLSGGAHFVLKSIAWLVENEKLVSIPPKEQTRHDFSLTEIQRKLAMVFVVGIIPVLVILTGGIMWWVRRRG